MELANILQPELWNNSEFPNEKTEHLLRRDLEREKNFRRKDNFIRVFSLVLVFIISLGTTLITIHLSGCMNKCARPDHVIQEMALNISRLTKQITVAEEQIQNLKKMGSGETTKITKGSRGDKMSVGNRGPVGQRGVKGSKGDQGLTGTKGEKGAKGETGETGLHGPTGMKGEAGNNGTIGDKGPVGDRGPVGLKGEKGTKGPSGEKGSKGDRGPVGEKGEEGKGDKGPSGEKGSKGDKGLMGDKGSSGNPGLKGEKGEPGLVGQKGQKGSSGETAKTFSCGFGWNYFSGSCYFFQFGTKKTWHSAKYDCRRRGGYLVKIDNRVENWFLKSIVKAHKGNVWIGLSDTDIESRFTWESDKSPLTFNDWAPGEPNDYGPTQEDCVHYFENLSYSWNDTPCSGLMWYICEKRA